MIRYAITKEDLYEKINKKNRTWLKRASKRTDELRQLGYYKKGSNIWRQIIQVYMDLQHGKCAYCEKKQESNEISEKLHEIEHYRPKGTVTYWRVPEFLQDYSIPISGNEGQRDELGYYLLAFHPLNYCASCTVCNSSLKNNYFPIAGIRQTTGDDPKALIEERPYLIFPVGNFDEDPEDLIEFTGVSPQAKIADGHRHYRALISIEFFELDHGRRQKELYLQRADVIVSIYNTIKLRDSSTNDEDRELYQNLIDLYTSPARPHTNCARCFKRLCDQDMDEAKQIFLDAHKYLHSTSWA